jgi:hypothetical protein
LEHKKGRLEKSGQKNEQALRGVRRKTATTVVVLSKAKHKQLWKSRKSGESHINRGENEA